MTILFVDDEPSILSSLRRLFRPHGYRILTAEGGIAGLEILAAEEVNMVISDMHMPEMDGTKFLEKVHAGWPGIIRISLTGYADINSTIDAVSKSEIFCYISKPWNDNEIVLTVREAFERQRLQNDNIRLGALKERHARQGRLQRWMLLSIPAVALALVWCSVNFFGWPGGKIVEQHALNTLFLYIFAIWGGLIAVLLVVVGALWKKET